MSNQLNYASEKLSGAMGTLVSDGPLRERLVGAFVYNLTHVPIGGVPADYRERFEKLRDEMTAVDATGDEGTVRASVDAASNEKLNKWAYEILCVYTAVEQAMGASE